MQPLQNSAWRLFKSLQTEPPCDPAQSSWLWTQRTGNQHAREIPAQLCLSLYNSQEPGHGTAGPCVHPQVNRQGKCGMCTQQNVGSGKEKNGITTFAGRRTELEAIVLKETSRAQKDKRPRLRSSAGSRCEVTHVSTCVDMGGGV